MRRIMIVVGHPTGATLCEALGHAYRKGAQEAGHEARLFNLAQMSFDPILHDGFRRVQPLEPDLRAAYEALTASDHVVLIFPLSCRAIRSGCRRRSRKPLSSAGMSPHHSGKISTT